MKCLYLLIQRQYSDIAHTIMQGGEPERPGSFFVTLRDLSGFMPSDDLAEKGEMQNYIVFKVWKTDLHTKCH